MIINDSFNYSINKFKYIYHMKKMKNKMLINDFVDTVNELKFNINRDLLYLEHYLILIRKSINKILNYIYFSHVKSVIKLKLRDIIYFVKLNNNILTYNKKYIIIEIKKLINKINKYTHSDD
ncbi:unknown similar to AMEV117 [Choristoneura rosaceana entomopoxvirus 'L']|uniref:N1R/p28-like protein n=1 Tax=Choristoneura rosaceana entomopoxvirus 'L' TaxID=1293539 RepID=A0ABM9QKH8_9POXV|nr:unknown similar to AMEV117 [Choristoneura rosaceana entomopoxvirus 'L']CCU56034.1 unknown similar to AMEV117 [Choristoneura rosaceana entomopoxvirus 'L']